MKQKLWLTLSAFAILPCALQTAPNSTLQPTRALKTQSIIGNFILAGSETIEGNNNVYGNKTINGGLTVNGNETIRNNIIILGRLLTQVSNPPSFSGGLTLTGNPQQACIIFKDTSLNEKARICSSSIAGDKGIFVSLDNGSTQNLRVANGGNVTITSVNSTSGSPTLTVNSNASVGALSAVGKSTLTAPAIQLSTNNPAASVNDSFLRVNGSGAVTQGLPGYVVTNTANFATYFPAYAPLTAAMTPGSTVSYYGDSITVGDGVTVAQRWATLVSNNFGVVQNNQGVDGARTNDAVSNNGTSGPHSVYNTRPPGTNGTVFLAYGTNDVNATNETPNLFDEIRRTFESIVLFCCLPDSQKIDTRSIPVGPNRTGTWTNSPYTFWGLQTSVAGSSLTATVTGRFVCFSSPGLAPSPTLWTVSVDGTPIGVAQMAKNTQTTDLGGTFNNSLWIYDTGSANNATHTIQVTYTAGSNATGLISWFSGFNLNNANANTIFVRSTPTAYWSQFNTNIGTELRRFTWNQILFSVCRRFRTEYGLPVYYIDIDYPWIVGMIQVDGLHPNADGHQYIANRIIQAINNGEFNYLLTEQELF